MKKMILALVMSLVIPPLSFAADEIRGAAPGDVSGVAEASLNTEGTVESVSVADASEGTKAEVAVIADNGDKVTYAVKDVTVIYDAAFKPITLDKLKAGDKIAIKCVIKNGIHEAVIINVKS